MGEPPTLPLHEFVAGLGSLKNAMDAMTDNLAQLPGGQKMGTVNSSDARVLQAESGSSKVVAGSSTQQGDALPAG